MFNFLVAYNHLDGAVLYYMIEILFLLCMLALYSDRKNGLGSSHQELLILEYHYLLQSPWLQYRKSGVLIPDGRVFKKIKKKNQLVSNQKKNDNQIGFCHSLGS